MTLVSKAVPGGSFAPPSFYDISHPSHLTKDPDTSPLQSPGNNQEDRYKGGFTGPTILRWFSSEDLLPPLTQDNTPTSEQAKYDLISPILLPFPKAHLYTCLSSLLLSSDISAPTWLALLSPRHLVASFTQLHFWSSSPTYPTTHFHVLLQTFPHLLPPLGGFLQISHVRGTYLFQINSHSN